jgi:glutamate dehydrogenase (NADP+)
VDNKLKIIMKNIHRLCVEASEQYHCKGNYVAGANIAGFTRVANAMMDHGLV